MNIIGTRLRELRQSAKLSQVKIAEVVGSRQSAIARFESGEAHVPAEVMIRYADYFDVSLDYIFFLRKSSTFSNLAFNGFFSLIVRGIAGVDHCCHFLPSVII